jgi:hypothetical protein
MQDLYVLHLARRAEPRSHRNKLTINSDACEKTCFLLPLWLSRIERESCCSSVASLLQLLHADRPGYHFAQCSVICVQIVCACVCVCVCQSGVEIEQE